MHFTLVHRPQNDPLIHDETAPAMVLNPTALRNGSKKLDDLASELGSEASEMRDNEGEAANHGVYYDDSEYDYMQHLRDLGSGAGEATWIEATSGGGASKTKGKQKQSLEDALREMDVRDRGEALLDEDMLPSKNLQHITYQAQQDVPDAIAGFQPDMDPRLREVLEALEDDAYVDGDDDGLFRELAEDGRELDRDEFEEEAYGGEYGDGDGYYDDEDGWESDATEKPAKEDADPVPLLVRTASTGENVGKNAGEAAKDDAGADKDGDTAAAAPPAEWLDDFAKFKKDQAAGKKPLRGPAAPEDGLSSVWTRTTHGGRRKKRKGALTDPSNYSMTSSSLVRTEQLQILDARFDKIDEEYAEDEGAAEGESAASTASSVQGPLRSDFDGIMDEFLSNSRPVAMGKKGRKKVNAIRAENGLRQLDEIRRGLGPPRIRGMNA